MDNADLRERKLHLLRESLVRRTHTMLERTRLDEIKYCLEYCLKNDIPGDFIETGVWRGGACIFAKGVLEARNVKNRKVYVADSFEGLPKPEPEKYPLDKEDRHYTYDYLRVSQEEVESNFRIYNLLDENVIFVKGFFEHSLPKLDMKSLAVLRVDCDMYSSTTQVLEALYDKLSVGGFIILDDFAKVSHSYHAKDAVIHFRNKRNITEKMIRDNYSAYWQKERI